MMTNRQIKAQIKARWKKSGAGRVVLMAEHIVDEKEVAAEVVRVGWTKWKVVIWSWGSDNPEPIRFDGDWVRYATAKKAKQAAEEAFIETFKKPLAFARP